MTGPEHRVTFAELIDDETPEHDAVFHRASAIEAHDVVLDVGCGTGRSTRRAARAASAGSVVGIDISAPSIEHARALTAAEGLVNVTYECADAAKHRLPTERFDVCISSFGAMFFAEPRAAFGHIARSMRPGGRLVVLVWQSYADNEWAVAVGDAVGRRVDAAPFSLADPAVVRDVLGDFTGLDFIDVRAPVLYGPDAEAAYGFASGFTGVRAAFEQADPAAVNRAKERLHEVCAAHETSDGVRFDSRAWVITARRY
jgi:SAM-dependent methyltransferase